MTYTNDIPQSGETLGGTRARINDNFKQIATVEAVNHVAFNSSGEGKHKFLQMPEQGSAPTTASNEGGVYTKVGTNPAESNLFFRAENSGGGGGKEYQMTSVSNANKATFGVNTNYSPAGGSASTGGWTFMPGGLIYQWGFLQAPTSSKSLVIKYQHEFQTLLTAGFTLARASGTTNDTQNFAYIRTSTLDATGFTIIRTSDQSQTYNYYFWAIGIGFA